MTAPTVVIDDADVLEALARLQAMGEELDPVMEAIGRSLKTNIQLGFQNGTDPYGRPWAPLKIRAGTPLRDKGHLMNSIDYRVEGDSVVVGTNREYAPTHQFGDTIKPKNAKRLVFPGPGGALIFATEVTIPARPFFPLDGFPQQWGDDLLAVIRDEVTDAWRAE